MLERTAATLESCTSLHALPSATQSLRSRRKLHTGFWQHGAAAIDLSNPSLALYSTESNLPASEPPSAPVDTLAASTFLLDFLYPNGAAALLRRFAPGLPDRQVLSIQMLQSSRSRMFTSSAVAASTRPFNSKVSDIVSRTNEPSPTHNDQETSTIPPAEDTDGIEEEDLEAHELAEENTETALEETDAASHDADMVQTRSGPSFAGAGSKPELMRELMATTDTEYFGSIWQLYHQLESHLQPEFRPEIIAYLHRSANLIDSRRIVLLFAQIDDNQCTPAVLTSVVNAHLRLGNEIEALDLYHDGLERRSIVGGLDELLQYAFKKTKWSMIKEVWLSYHAIYNSHGIKVGPLRRLAAVPDLGSLALEFAHEIKSEEDGNNMQKLTILLQKVARRALQQPCKPHEALPLLKIVDQVKWYNIYLSEAIQRGQWEGLPEIYRAYRSFPGVKPYWGILHGMFEIFYPDDVVGLEQVFEDYHVSYGGLDRWGFRKFLKFYASRGDIRSLERLWGHYVYTYKHRKVLEDPETFNYVLNAYATVGNVKGTRRVFQELTSKYGLVPSIHSWNILLKSHVRLGSYDSALSVFEEICQAASPDSFTFATIMSLTALHGDMDMTLKLFQRAGESHVKIDIPIVHAIVEAYCRNQLFSEALATCANATRQEIPGDHIKLWNTLLRHHSERRAFGAVCRVVAIMAQYKVEWSSDTHDVLLQALVRCKQTHHAYNLLRQARRDQTFTLTPEHFSTVMDGGLRTRELGLVSATSRMQRRTGSPMSLDVMILQIDAMMRQGIYGRVEQKKNIARQMLASYIQEMTNALDMGQEQGSDDGDSARETLRSADSLHRLRRILKKAIKLLSRHRDFAMVKELQQLQARVIPETTTDVENLPFETLNTWLKENVMEKKYDAAKSNWELIWQRAMRLGHPSSYEGSLALPRYRFVLSGTIRTMREMYLDQQDPKGFKALMDRALDAGFRLDNRAMNLACQALAEMGYWMEACELCETHLMPTFSGWKLNRAKRRLRCNIPLDKRRVGSAPQWLRPTSYTLIILAKTYMEVKSNAPWSASGADRLSALQERCPRLSGALNSLQYSGVGIEQVVFGGRQLDDQTQKDRGNESETLASMYE